MLARLFRRTHAAALALAALLAVLPLSISVTPQHGLEVGLQQAQAQQLTDYAENKIVDAVMRAQALGAPATWYVALYTTAPTDSTPGTEVSTSGTNYARASLAASLANWAGTQSAGSTTASSGTGGQTSNNAAITFNVPSASWGTVGYWCLMDAVTAGNAWICQNLTVTKTINAGDTVSFAIGALTVTFQ